MVEGARVVGEQPLLLVGAQGLERQHAADVDADLLDGHFVDATSSARSRAGIRPRSTRSAAMRVPSVSSSGTLSGNLRVGTRDRGDVDHQSRRRLDLEAAGGSVRWWRRRSCRHRRAGAGGVDHHAVVVGAGLLPEPVEAAGGAPCAGEGGDGDREAEAGDDGECCQRDEPPSPIGTHPHADRVAHALRPRTTPGSVTGGRSGPQSCYRRLVSGGGITPDPRRRPLDPACGTPSRARRAVTRSDPDAGPAAVSSADSPPPRASSRARCMPEAGVRSVREREVLLGVGAPDVEPVRIRERSPGRGWLRRS